MAAHDGTGGTGFFDKSGMNKFLAELGLGLIMGGQAQPYGRSRGQAMSPYFQRAVKGMFPSEDTKLRRRYLKGQIGEMESKAEKRKSQARSLRELSQFYRNQEALKRFGVPRGPGAAPQPQPWPPGPGGPLPGPSVPMGVPPSPAARGVPMRGSPGRIPPALLLGAFGNEALPYLMRERKGFTLSPGQTRYGPQGRKMASVPGIPKAPTTRTRIAGGESIVEEFDRATNSWREVGQGPRWDPDKAGLTSSQQAGNQEIDTARAQLRQLQAEARKNGVDLYTELQSRMMATNPMTGMREPNYSSHWSKMAWLAMQAKPGGDNEQAMWARTVMYPATKPKLPKVPPKKPPQKGPGVWERGMNYFGELGSSLVSPPASAEPKPQSPHYRRLPLPGQRPSPTPGGQPATGPANQAPDLPLNAEGEIDKARLEKGMIYPVKERDGGTSFWIWNGTAFNRVGR